MRAPFVFALALTCAFFSAELPGQLASVPGGPPAPPPAPTKPPPQPRGRVTGTVICGDTRQPARGAVVMLALLPKAKDVKPQSNGMQLSAHVGVSGSFEIDHVPPGEYGVMAFQQGYLSVLDRLDAQAIGAMIGGGGDAERNASFFTAMEGGPTVTVAGDGTATTEIVIERGAAISGRILYADGAPASSVSLVAEDAGASETKTKDLQAQINPVAMMKSLLIHQSSATDDLGRFRVSGLKPGKYRLAAVPPIDLTQGGDEFGFGIMVAGLADPRQLRFYAGDTYHRKKAKIYELNAGDEVTEVEIRLPIDGFHTVRGHVTAVDGRPINMGQLSLTSTDDDSLVYYGQLDLEGGFQIHAVLPGTYTLQVKQARIGGIPAGMPAEVYPISQLQPINAFADGTTAVLVKEADVNGVALSLTETAMPPSVAPGQPPAEPSDD